MSVFLPALQQRSTSPGSRCPLSFRSILNPEGDTEEQKPDQRRSASQQELMAPFESQGLYITRQNNTHQGQNNPPIVMETERSMIPLVHYSQSSIQTMAIKTQQGHYVQIPVNVQTASKVAKEKRKRNAAASTRFRVRRKEKAHEASINVSRLQQEIRHATEDAEYYRAERDYFKNIVLQQPGAEKCYARPTSPRLWRTSVPPSIAPSTAGGGSVGSYEGYEDNEPPSMNAKTPLSK